jgi:hypothetical protein
MKRLFKVVNQRGEAVKDQGETAYWSSKKLAKECRNRQQAIDDGLAVRNKWRVSLGPDHWRAQK